LDPGKNRFIYPRATLGLPQDKLQKFDYEALLLQAHIVKINAAI